MPASNRKLLLFHSCRPSQFSATVDRLLINCPTSSITPLLLSRMRDSTPLDRRLDPPIFFPPEFDRYDRQGISREFIKRVKAENFNEIIIPLNNPTGIGYRSVIDLAYGLVGESVRLIYPDLRDRSLPSSRLMYLLEDFLIRSAYAGMAVVAFLLTPFLLIFSLIAWCRVGREGERTTAEPPQLDPLPENPAISVVIPTLGESRTLTQLLRSLARQTRQPDEVLLIVKGDLDDDLRSDLANSFPPSKLRIIAKPFNVTQAKNHGAGLAAGDIVVFFDDDIIPDANFIADLMKPLIGDKSGRVAAAAGYITNQAAVRPWPVNLIEKLFLLPAPGNGRFRRSGFPSWLDRPDEDKAVEFLPGGLTAWRRDVLRRFESDPLLPGYGYLDDVDFSYRTSRLFEHVLVPRARCLHLSAAYGRQQSRGRARMLARLHIYLFVKNRPRDPITVLAFGLSLWGLFLRALVRRDLSEGLAVLSGIKDGLSGVI